ncbi:MAG: nicotinamide-nucleotide amidohydrolase family protein [Clostridia bacterium]|nr:nicotinamide-nucleotide amidohydrolase family protein [Clostridia bacterium]
MIELCTGLVNLLKEKSLTLATSESCTGGLIAKSITDVSGCSSVYYGGVVSYDNSVKQNILGVKEKTLSLHGAVSAETAYEMALGVKKALNTSIGISTTGIAGPLGGSEEKPVGTVYIGIAYGDNLVETRRLNIGSSLSRDEIRHEATRIVLEWVSEKISKNY